MISNKEITYTFKPVDSCNMCESNSSNQQILGRRLNKSQGKKPEIKIGISTTVCKCLNCGLVYSNPLPIPLSLQDHYGVPPEDYWIEDYFAIDDNYFKREIENLKKLNNFNLGQKALDIGAGIGKQMIALTKSGFDSYGLEPSESFYQRAVTKMGINPNRLKLGTIEEIEYKENYFDFISFGAVLEHLYDPSKAIQKALKWLKPGGIIHIEVPSSDWLVNKIINLFYKFKFSNYVGNISPMHEPYHLYEFGLDSFKLNASKYAYKIEKYEYYVCKTYMPKFVDKIIKPYMRRTNTGMQLCIYLRKK